MKEVKDIMKADGMHVIGKISHENRGYGFVTVNGWTGTVTWGEDKKPNLESVIVSLLDYNKTPSLDDIYQLRDIFFTNEKVFFQIPSKKNMHWLRLWCPKGSEF